MAISKQTWGKILQVIGAIIAAVAGAFGLNACM